MKNLLILLFLAIVMTAHTQVSINNDGSLPDNSSMLDVKSTVKGMLVPRMNTAQRDAIASPATGLLIFSTDNNNYYSNKGTPAVPNWVIMNSRWLSSGSDIYFSEGNVGIGTATPSAILDVTGGNNWDVINGEGDFRLGNSLYRLKVGVALDGGGAGAVGFMQYGQPGGYNVLSLGSQGHNLLFINGSTQKVGIGTDNPVATFDIQGTLRVADGTQGIGKVLISNSDGVASWAGIGIGWSLTGNSGTSSTVNFIGTTDNNPLTFRVNNETAGKIDHLLSNTSLGYLSLQANISGSYNTAFGRQSLYSNTTGDYNTANGMHSLFFNTTGNGNSALGVYSLFNNTTGTFNTAIGLQALFLNSTGYNNTATGAAALYDNTIGNNNSATGHSALTSNTSGNFNTANGKSALHYNTTGYENTALGGNSLYSNTTGYQNTAIGFQALYSNTTGIYNTSTGWQSLLTNSTGGYNTANGYWALSFNTSGYRNTSTGFRSLTYNSTGSYNTANGVDALLWNTEGFQNTALGANSLYNITFGAYNTAIGFNTGPTSGILSNTTCIGTDAAATATDIVRIGNVYVNSIGGYQNWTNISDSRFKENVKEDVPGLSFINQLHPVTYQLNREKINKFTGVTERQEKLKEKDPSVKFLTGEKYSEVTTGFIAQEVEAAAQSIGFVFSGVDAPKDENDFYGLRYAEFVVPLVKAVQELNAKNEEQKITNEELKLAIAELKIQNAQLMQLIEKYGNK